MRPVRITKSLAAASASSIAVPQLSAGAGSLVLVGGGTVSLDTPRRVLLTAANNESGNTFVITGNQRIDGTGNTITETLTGPNAGSVATQQDFGQVTSVTISGASAGLVSVGTNTVGSTQWILIDRMLNPVNLQIGVEVIGTVNYTVQYTYDGILGGYDPQGGAWSMPDFDPVTYNDILLTNVSSNGQTSINQAYEAWRVLINSGTGSIQVAGFQTGVGGIGG